MKTPPEGTGWERRILAASALLLTAGYGLVAAGYFLAPQGWSLRIEHWFYRHFPLYYECQFLGSLFLLGLWLTGCFLLLWRARNHRRIPWAGLGWAALTPALLILFNAAFFHAAARVAPLSLGR